jgi:hypothetical protein
MTDAKRKGRPVTVSAAGRIIIRATAEQLAWFKANGSEALRRLIDQQIKTTSA